MKSLDRRPVIVQALYSFQIGGSERMAALLASEMSRRGFSVLALAFYGDERGPIRSQLEQAGIECIGYSFEARSRLRRATLGWEIRTCLQSRGVTAIHLHHGVSAVRAARAARRAGVKHIVMTEHSHAALQDMPRYRRQVGANLRFVDHATGVNEEVVQFLNSHFTRSLATPAEVIPNAIDDRLFALERSEGNRVEAGLQNSFVFVYVGRLHFDKDLPTLLAALSLLAQRAPDIHPMLVVAGDGPERAALATHARLLGIESRVQMWGMQHDVARALSVADAFVMSSVREGLPMALIEAMAAGLPCVATAVGSVASVLADGRGQVVSSGDAHALSRSMLAAMSDRNRSAAMGRSARSYAREHFSLGPVVSRYLSLLGQPPRWDQSTA